MSFIKWEYTVKNLHSVHRASQDEVKQLRSKLLFQTVKFINLSNFSKSGEAVAVVQTDFKFLFFFPSSRLDFSV